MGPDFDFIERHAVYVCPHTRDARINPTLLCNQSGYYFSSDESFECMSCVLISRPFPERSYCFLFFRLNDLPSMAPGSADQTHTDKPKLLYWIQGPPLLLYNPSFFFSQGNYANYAKMIFRTSYTSQVRFPRLLCASLRTLGCSVWSNPSDCAFGKPVRSDWEKQDDTDWVNPHRRTTGTIHPYISAIHADLCSISVPRKKTKKRTCIDSFLEVIMC